MKKRMILDKWVVASVLYVGVVVGGFSAYEEFVADEPKAVAVAAHGGSEADHEPETEEESVDHHGGENGGSHGHESAPNNETNGVNVYVQSQDDELDIFLKDKTGNPVHDLEINHEKILHLIVVDEHLQKYYHLHPEQTSDGVFSTATGLPDGFYKAFVDIKPKDLAYHVSPVPFIVGNPSGPDHTHNEGLKADTDFTQVIDGEKVTMQLNTTKVNEPVTLTFDLNKTNLTPYLGAMGHVVILDEMGQNFLHVHPANDQEPIFETQFEQPGIYKIWAEFQQNGKVRAFPFVVEIEGED
ncbi:hypothetical protein [Ammoniphilus resinae]|uniref:Secreted protein n=1 Tax=Ammoniphilus resinae TaxID=861532 RepID=A0ABS4GW68_9BACL|nr:hypothetical protein [Ammoniphilus resinae]MBP1934513.1 hypothetical protein [Ammoniphilus resinae]